MTKITVVIPTRERCETLPHTIRTCLSQDHPDFEVLVSDNVSNDRTREIVESIADSRLRYVRTPRRLSMSGNFNFAIDQVQDGWITAIGDDDGLMPGALSFADRLIDQYGELPISAGSVYYCWPGLNSDRMPHSIQFSDFDDQVTTHDSLSVVRDRVRFREHEASYIWGMAGVYRGFLPTSLVQRARHNGRYINSVTPDAYSAFTTALLSPKYIRANRPLFVEGVSAKSNGAAQATFSDARAEQQYVSENDIAIHQGTVYCGASSFVMVEAFLQAKSAFPELALGLDPDFQAMCVRARLETLPNKRDVVLDAVGQIRKRYGLPDEPMALARQEMLHRRLQSVRMAWRGMSVDADAYRIQNVFDASIAASAIWNYKRGTGHKERWSLLSTRFKRFMA